MKTICIFLLLITLLSVNTFAFDSMHGHKTAAFKLNYDSLFQTATPLKDSPEGKALIDNCIKAYGGEEKLNKLESCHLVYSTDAFMMKQSITVEKSFTRNRQYKITRYQQPQNESRILNGNDSWFIGRDTVLFLNSGRYKAELFSYLTLCMPLAIKTEPFSEIRYGTRTNDSLLFLYLKKNDTLMSVLGIDPKDYLIKNVEGVIYQDTNTFVFINKFDDFRDEDSYLFPHSLINISMGLEVGRSKLLSVKINPIFKDNEFLPDSIEKNKETKTDH